MVIKDVNYIKGIAEGTLQNILNNDVLDKDRLYLIDDLPSTCSITNKMMQDALSDLKIKACFVEGDIYICSDTGIYKENTFYKFTGDSWEDITKTSAETDSTGTNIAQKFSQIDSSLDDLVKGLNTTQSDIVKTKKEISNLEETTSILIDNGDGTKYLADNGLYQTISGGIETLIGTEERPINLYTDLKNGKYYLLKGIVFRSGNNLTLQTEVLTFKDYFGKITTYIYNLVGNWSLTGSSFYYNITSDGDITLTRACKSIRNLNNIAGNATINDIFAPTNGGTQGQILQSNGDAEPIWIDLIQPTVERLI